MILVLLAFVTFMQAQIQPPALSTSPSDLVVKSTATPVPSTSTPRQQIDQKVLNQSAFDSAPFAIAGIERNIAQSGQTLDHKLINVGGGLAKIRKDLLLNNSRVRGVQSMSVSIAKAMMAVLIVVLGFRGLLATAVGSDSREATEMVMPFLLWSYAAVTSFVWISLMVDAFGLIATALSASAQSAFGDALDPTFIEQTTAALIVQLLLVIVFLLVIAWICLQLWIDTLFLAVMIAVASVLWITMPFPFLNRYGKTWWNMVPGVLADMCLIAAAMTIFGPVLEQFVHQEPIDMLLWRFAGSLMLLKLRRVFGTGMPGSHSPIAAALLLSRFLGRGRGAATSEMAWSSSSSTASMSTEKTTTATEPTASVPTVPRYGYAVSGHYSGSGSGRAASEKARLWEAFDGPASIKGAMA